MSVSKFSVDTSTNKLTVSSATEVELAASGITTNVLGPLNAEETLAATGATTLSSTLGVTGATSLGSTLGVTGATSLGSTLGVTGDATMNGDLDVVGLVHLTTFADFHEISTPITNPGLAHARLYYKDTEDGFYYKDHGGFEWKISDSYSGPRTLYTAYGAASTSATSLATILPTTNSSGSAYYTPVVGDTVCFDFRGTLQNSSSTSVAWQFDVVLGGSNLYTQTFLVNAGLFDCWQITGRFYIATIGTAYGMTLFHGGFFGSAVTVPMSTTADSIPDSSSIGVSAGSIDLKAKCPGSPAVATGMQAMIWIQ